MIKAAIRGAGARLIAIPFRFRAIRTRIVPIVYHQCLKALVSDHKSYSPIGSTTRSYSRPAESFDTRWEVLARVLRECEARNVLDVGCAEGYMVRKAALECGVFAVGIERERNRLLAGMAFSELSNDEGYGILPLNVDAESLRKLPTFDVVVCFSVLHHVIRHQGVEEGRRFLKSLASITGKRFLFDMGSPEEKSNKWAAKLEFLSGDVPGKTMQLLYDAGFASVHHVADTYGIKDTVNRPLFVCGPPQVPRWRTEDAAPSSKAL